METHTFATRRNESIKNLYKFDHRTERFNKKRVRKSYYLQHFRTHHAKTLSKTTPSRGHQKPDFQKNLCVQICIDFLITALLENHFFSWIVRGGTPGVTFSTPPSRFAQTMRKCCKKQYFRDLSRSRRLMLN